MTDARGVRGRTGTGAGTSGDGETQDRDGPDSHDYDSEHYREDGHGCADHVTNPLTYPNRG